MYTHTHKSEQNWLPYRCYRMDGCSQCILFSLKTLNNHLGQVDENKTEALFICSHEVRQWQRSMFDRLPRTKQRKGGKVSPQRPLSLIMPYFFLCFYLSLAFVLYTQFSNDHSLFVSIFLISQASLKAPPILPFLLSVTAWNLKWDKKTPILVEPSRKISHWHICQLTLVNVQLKLNGSRNNQINYSLKCIMVPAVVTATVDSDSWSVVGQISKMELLLYTFNHYDRYTSTHLHTDLYTPALLCLCRKWRSKYLCKSLCAHYICRLKYRFNTIITTIPSLNNIHYWKYHKQTMLGRCIMLLL